MDDGDDYRKLYLRQRHAMVDRQIADRGVGSPLVLEAMKNVPREAFLPRSLHEFAYEDSALPIAEGPTISQPYIVAFMVEALQLKGANGYWKSARVRDMRRLCHETRIPSFALGLREPATAALDQHLHEFRPERAIGVIYRPETERASHYFNARLADQFDEYIWFDRSEAVTPLSTRMLAGVPETYPFAL